MAAVGDRGDVAALGCLQRWGYVVVVAVCGRLFRGRSLFVVVVVGGRGRSLSVVVSVDGGGKQKRSPKQILFVIHHKYITNK